MRQILAVLLVFLTTETFAMQCYLTLMQGKCWHGYKITISAVDSISGDELIKPVTLEGKKGDSNDKFWKRVPFECKAKQGISLKASFSPPIWSADKDKAYPGSETIYLPETVKKDIFAWNVPICYPSAFENIPLPPSADANCDCDDIKGGIPEVTKQDAKSN